MDIDKQAYRETDQVVSLKRISKLHHLLKSRDGSWGSPPVGNILHTWVPSIRGQRHLQTDRIPTQCRARQTTMCIHADGSQTHHSTCTRGANRYGISTTKTPHRSMQTEPTLKVQQQLTHSPVQCKTKRLPSKTPRSYPARFELYPIPQLPCLALPCHVPPGPVLLCPVS